MQYSRLGVCRLVTFKGVAQVVLVVHVTLGAQVVVEAHLALPSHSHDAVLLAAVTDDVGVAYACSEEHRAERFPSFTHMLYKQFLKNGDGLTTA